MPKFRGDSEDWLDDEASRRRGRAGPSGAGKAGRASLVPAEETNAIVAEVFPKQCRVRLDDGGSEILCAYRRASVFGHAGEGVRDRSPVAVGDRVKVSQTSPDAGVVEGVSARRNFLARPAPGRESFGEEQNVAVRHVVAANLDLLVVVASALQPEFNDGLVDRCLVAATASSIPPLLVVTKVDLLPAESDLRERWLRYRELGAEVREVSSKRGDGIDELRNLLKEKRAAFVGQSGVGKTSLLRVLLEASVGRVAEISQATGKGKHTTTSAVLIREWIDTPGVREFGLSGVAPEALAQHFPEFAVLHCPTSGCLHQGEPGCQAETLPRYPSYRRILASLQAGEN